MRGLRVSGRAPGSRAAVTVPAGSLMPSAHTGAFFWDGPGQRPQNPGISGSNLGLVPFLTLCAVSFMGETRVTKTAPSGVRGRSQWGDARTGSAQPWTPGRALFPLTHGRGLGLQTTVGLCRGPGRRPDPPHGAAWGCHYWSRRNPQNICPLVYTKDSGPCFLFHFVLFFL